MFDSAAPVAPQLSMRRRHLSLAAVVLFSGVTLIASGFAFVSLRRAELELFIASRAPALGKSAETVISALLDRVQLRSARSALGLPKLERRTSQVETYAYLKDEGARLVVTHIEPGSSPVKLRVGDQVVLNGRVNSDEAGVYRWTAQDPTGLMVCVKQSDIELICGITSLHNIIGAITSSTPLISDYELYGPGNDLLERSAQFDLSASDFNASTKIRIGADIFVLTIQAGERAKSAFAIALGYWFSSLAALFLVAVTWLIQRHHRASLSQLALTDEIGRTKDSRKSLMLSSMRNIAESTGTLLWFVSDDGKFELFGPWQDVAGIHGTSVDFDEVVANISDKETVSETLKNAIKSRSHWNRVIVRDIDGERLTFQSTASPLYDGEGGFLGFTGVSLNITDALKTQSKVISAEAFRASQTTYLQHLSREIIGPALHVREAIAVLQDMATKTVDPEERRLYDLAATESKKLSDVVRRAIELMTLRGSTVKDSVIPLSLDSMVRDAIKSAEDGAGSAGQVHLDPIPPEITVLANEKSSARMLEILLQNAIRYSGPSGQVKVRAVIGRNSFSLDIIDNGPGVSEEEMRLLGEPFFRGQSSVQKPGQGLGIPIALELASRTKATIQFRNAPGPAESGLMVVIVFPKA
ncbi:PAS domain-containing sensor histidine kinase [Paucibacter soli]|uniref:PAS domain-containing sensor histidine kinase n=1 Tax=Paucibacter soli TaxID=3133433 RepID=UPI00309E8DEC